MTSEGGKKRSGGQGDTLTGCIATVLAWRKAHNDQLWSDLETPPLENQEVIGLAVSGGSTITRDALELHIQNAEGACRRIDLVLDTVGFLLQDRC